jgi:hypothetical protein
MKDPLTLKSGATLEVGIASFAAGNKLMKTVARELSSVSFDLNIADLSDFSGQDVNVLKNAVFQLLQSDALEASLMECAKKSLYNGEKITLATFEAEDARQDYLPVAWEVMKANLTPFFKGLALSSSTSASPSSNDQKSA